MKEKQWEEQKTNWTIDLLRECCRRTIINTHKITTKKSYNHEQKKEKAKKKPKKKRKKQVNGIIHKCTREREILVSRAGGRVSRRCWTIRGTRRRITRGSWTVSRTRRTILQGKKIISWGKTNSIVSIRITKTHTSITRMTKKIIWENTQSFGWHCISPKYHFSLIQQTCTPGFQESSEGKLDYIEDSMGNTGERKDCRQTREKRERKRGRNLA